MPGTIIIEQFTSQLLQNNPLGDPHIRQIPIYLPPGYEGDEDDDTPLPRCLSPHRLYRAGDADGQRRSL